MKVLLLCFCMVSSFVFAKESNDLRKMVGLYKLQTTFNGECSEKIEIVYNATIDVLDITKNKTLSYEVGSKVDRKYKTTTEYYSYENSYYFQHVLNYKLEKKKMFSRKFKEIESEEFRVQLDVNEPEGLRGTILVYEKNLKGLLISQCHYYKID